MSKAIRDAKRPPMWDIEAGHPHAGQIVRVGARRVRTSDVADLALEEVQSFPVAGLIMGGVMFLCLATVLAYLVYEGGHRTRFLAGAGFLGALGLASLVEATGLRRLSHFELHISLQGGERIVFTSTDRADIQALALTLAAGRNEAAAA